MGGSDQRSSHSGSTSSDGEDGDAEWRAAIDGVAATTTFGQPSAANGIPSSSNGLATNLTSDAYESDDQAKKSRRQNLKHYQIKTQKLLDDMLSKTVEMVQDPVHAPNNGVVTNESGIRLFRNAPPGIVFDHVDAIERPKKRPKLLPGEEIDEKSKKFGRQLQSVVVDGASIMAAARDSSEKSLAKLQAKDVAARAAAKREEERVAELKRIRGERWLPSIARDMQIKL